MSEPTALSYGQYIKPDKGAEDTCLWCGETITDGSEESGYTGPGPDWMDDGDFGCGGSPLNDEEGTGGHQTLADVAFDMWELNQRREATYWADAAAGRVTQAGYHYEPDGSAEHGRWVRDSQDEAQAQAQAQAGSEAQG